VISVARKSAEFVFTKPINYAVFKCLNIERLIFMCYNMVLC